MARGDAGFTLLEVLVAMTILAVAATGLLAASGQSLAQMQMLEKKTQAQWVAENRLTELRAARAWPEPGVRTDTVAFGEQQWQVRLTVSQTAHAGMRQIKVEVSQGEASLATLTGFTGKY